MPPCAWIARSQASTAASAAGAFAGGGRNRRPLAGRRHTTAPTTRASARARAPRASSRADARRPGSVPIGRPNCSRSATYSTASSSARAPTPTASSARSRASAAELRQHVGRAELAPGLAARDDAERAGLVARVEQLALAAVELEDPVAADDGDARRRVEVRDERSERERPARLACGDARLLLARAGTGGATTVEKNGACRSARPASSCSTACSRKPSPAPPCSSGTETPVQPSSASCAQVGSGVASRNARACARSSSCSGVKEGSSSARPRQPEHPLGDDAAQDLRRARLDRVAAAAELLAAASSRRTARSREELRVGAEQLERELRHALVRLRPLQLEDRALRARGCRSARVPTATGRRCRRSAWSSIHSRAIASRCSGVAPRSRASSSSFRPAPRGARRARSRACRARAGASSSPPASRRRSRRARSRRGTSTPLRKISLNSASPVIWRQRPHLDAGRVHVDDQVGQPLVALRVGVGAGEEDAEVGDVRVRRPHLLAVEHEAVAVEPAARADAGEVGSGSGSEKPWHQISSAARSGCRYRAFCSSVPCAMIVGPAMPSPITPTCGGASARASSSRKIAWWRGGRPRRRTPAAT